jgi:hypothetical protein
VRGHIRVAIAVISQRGGISLSEALIRARTRDFRGPVLRAISHHVRLSEARAFQGNFTDH